MKCYKILISPILFAFFFILITPVHGASQVGKDLSLGEILSLSRNIGGFLFILGGILAGITIIISGIMYFFAGSNTQKIGVAKGILKAGIIGTLIIFSMGTIVNVVRNLAIDPLQFFGGGGSGTPQAYGCSCVGNFLQCVPQGGGAYSDPACYGTCPGTVPC